MKTLTLSGLAELSKRQQEILQAACGGLPDKLIADRLGVSPRTLEGHGTVFTSSALGKQVEGINKTRTNTVGQYSYWTNGVYVANWYTLPVVTNNNAVIKQFNILPPD